MYIKDWKRELFSIPNLLSFFRLVLIPVYAYIYLNATQTYQYFIAGSIMAVSCLTDMIEVMKVTKSMLRIGNTGRQIDAEGRKLYDKGGYLKYLVCPFAHTMGLMEAEAPFFGPNSDDVLQKNMIVNVDVSFFGHPVLNGLRVETCYVITERGAKPLCPEFEEELFNYVK